MVLVGGGDPTLAVNEYPSSDYPRPATLAQLAAGTARALKAQGHLSVRLGYDTSLFSGPGTHKGGPIAYISTGNVTPIAALEADQGRLTPSGALEDSDDPVNFRPRTTDPVGMTVAAFAALLGKDGITVTGAPAQAAAPTSAPVLASVSSPPLVAIAEQMLHESNNVIAENLARHVAIALGMPATFTRRRGRRHDRAAAARDHDADQPGRRQRPVAADAIAPETLVRVLALAASTPRLRGAVTGLPVAGFTGTLSAGDSVFGGISGMAARRAESSGPRPATWPRWRRSRASSTTAPAACCSSRSWHRGCRARTSSSGRRRDRRGGRRPGRVRVFMSAGTPATISEHVR